MIAAQFRGGELWRQPHHRLHLSENGKPAHSASVRKQDAGLPIYTVTKGSRPSAIHSGFHGARGESRNRRLRWASYGCWASRSKPLGESGSMYLHLSEVLRPVAAVYPLHLSENRLHPGDGPLHLSDAYINASNRLLIGQQILEGSPRCKWTWICG